MKRLIQVSLFTSLCLTLLLYSCQKEDTQINKQITTEYKSIAKSRSIPRAVGATVVTSSPESGTCDAKFTFNGVQGGDANEAVIEIFESSVCIDTQDEFIDYFIKFGPSPVANFASCMGVPNSVFINLGETKTFPIKNGYRYWYVVSLFKSCEDPSPLLEPSFCLMTVKRPANPFPIKIFGVDVWSAEDDSFLSGGARLFCSKRHIEECDDAPIGR